MRNLALALMGAAPGVALPAPARAWTPKPGQFAGIHFKPDGDDGDDGEGEKPKTKRLDITQERLDEIIEERLNKQRKALEKEHAPLRAKLKELEDKLGEGAGKSKDGVKTYTQDEHARALADKDGEHAKERDALTKRIESLLTNAKKAALVDAAAKAKALDPQVVATLVGDQVVVGEGDALQVVDEQGRPRLDSKGNALGLEGLVAEFLESKPFLRAGANTPGAGSGTNNGNPGGKGNPPKPATTFAQASQQLAASLKGIV